MWYVKYIVVRKISPPPGFGPRTVQPVVSCYTDWTNPAPAQLNTWLKIVLKFIEPRGSAIENRNSYSGWGRGQSQIWLLLLRLFSFFSFTSENNNNNNNTIQIDIRGKISADISINQGVSQGCDLLPTLVIIYRRAGICDITTHTMKDNFRSTFFLFFANDHIILQKSEHDFLIIIYKIIQTAKEYNFTIYIHSNEIHNVVALIVY